MPFQQSDTLPDFEKLKVILLNSGLQVSDQPLYQTIINFLNSTSKLENIFDNRITELETIIDNLSVTDVPSSLLNVFSDDRDEDQIDSLYPIIMDTAGVIEIGGAAVADQIAIWASATTLKGDANLTWDGLELAIIGSVGIGTTTPSVKLEVVGAITATELIVSKSNAPANLILERVDAFMDASQDVGTIQFKGGEDGSEEIVAQIQAVPFDNWTNTSSPTALAFHTTPIGVTSAIERVRIKEDGNVGIGTIVPRRDLHIESGVPTLRMSDSNAATDQAVATLIEFYRANNTNRVGFFGMESASNDLLKLATDYAAGEIAISTGSSVEAVRIDNAGNVGIGTAGPTSLLDVNGNIKSLTYESDIVTGTAPLIVASTTKITNLNADLLDGISEAAFALLAGRSGGQVLKGGTGVSDNLTLQCTSGNAGDGTSIIFLGGNNGALEWARFKDRTSAGGSPRFGIGTTDPGFTFHVVSANVVVTAGDSQFTLGTNDSFAIDKGGMASFGGKYNTAGNTTLFGGIAGRKENTGDGDTDGYLQFRTRGASAHAERMRITSVGLMGLGITVPVGLLHVDQANTSGARPVIVLDQADVDEDYFKFIGTSDTNVDRALVDAANFTTPGPIAGYLKINIQDDQSTDPIPDGDYYIAFRAAPTA